MDSINKRYLRLQSKYHNEFKEKTSLLQQLQLLHFITYNQPYNSLKIQSIQALKYMIYWTSLDFVEKYRGNGDKLCNYVVKLYEFYPLMVLYCVKFMMKLVYCFGNKYNI